ncbi:TetR/AcrR family transcriptional regulator [Phototrophicus methaneseepsis]|uniref:TetR/AcrR family transcriptional regulator n=1 Tax=Phototrophicus methaneseepsis TaxID=2710758 RepID=A0A7S8ED52_9CHLR|nr:TetR/AcrR family transcriptional regulator [Phototrophicus methaneseepsis]QPC84782.1 TetR/AcrR family transcriptional regulator [Phototrophicus methaneseepsis]
MGIHYDRKALSGHNAHLSKGACIVPDASLQEPEARILQAARALLLHYGFDKTTLSNIADEAGVARSTLYKHWKRKDDIFRAVLAAESRIYIADVARRIQDDPQGGTFTSVFRHLFLALRDNDFLYALYTNENLILGKYLALLDLKSMYTRRMDLMSHFLTMMQQVGTVRQDVDVQTVGFVMSSIQYGMYRMNELMGGEYPISMDKSMDIVTEMIERYLEPETPGDLDAGKAIMMSFMDNVLSIVDEIESSDALSAD